LTTNKILTIATNLNKTIQTTDTYYLITNLGDAEDYSDELIINLYTKRWEIEVYFKSVKSLFKYEIFRIKQSEEIEKMKCICEITHILTKLLIIETLHTNYDLFINKLNPNVKFRNNPAEIYKTKVNINFSNFYEILCSKYLNLIVDAKLDTNILLYLKKAIVINKDKLNRKYERKSLVPFTKWYVKMYHKIYQDLKIYKAITEQNIESLDKNLKMQVNKIIKKYNCVIITEKT